MQLCCNVVLQGGIQAQWSQECISTRPRSGLQYSSQIEDSTAQKKVKNWFCLKGKYHENLMSFENPKTFVCQQKQENNCLVLL